MTTNIRLMTATTFTAQLFDVEAIESRVVTSEGRVTGLSKFKGREVKIVVLEEPSSCATITYGAGIDGGVPVPTHPTPHEMFVDLADSDAHTDPLSLTQTDREHEVPTGAYSSNAHIENMLGESTPC